MTRQNQQILFFAFLALVFYGVYSYYFGQEKAIADEPFTKGYSVENIEFKITDEKGDLTAKFISPSLLRYTDSQVIYIKEPNLWVFEKGIESWMITSEKAEYNADDNKIKLIDKLQARLLNSENNKKFNAQDLLINLDNKQAFTDNGITISENQLTLSGQVANINLKSNLIEVNNNVKAIYKSLK